MSREAVANVLAEIEEIHPEVVNVEDAAEIAVDDGLTQQEITEEVVAVDAGIQEVRRMEDTALALEDMAIVEDHISEASPTDLLLIETATRLAAAGSDVDVEEVIPGLESYAGKKISMEGIRQLASTIWTAIKTFCAKIWERVTHFFNLIITSLFGVKRALQKQKEKLVAMKAAKAAIKVGEEKISLGREGVNLSRNGKCPKKAADVLEGAIDFAKVIEWLTGDYTAKVINAYNKLGQAMASAKSGDKAVDVLTDITDRASKSDLYYYPTQFGMHSATHASYSSKDFDQSDSLPGEWVLLAHKNKGKVSLSDIQKNPTVVADEVSRRTIVLKKNSPAKPETLGGEFATMPLDKLEELNKWLDTIITHVNVYADTGKNRIGVARKAFEGAADAFGRFEVDGTSTEIRAVMRFSIMLTEAASQPITTIIAAANTLVRNYIVLTRRNLAAYA